MGRAAPSTPARYSGSFDLDGLVRAIGVAATLDAAATVEQLRIVHEREFGKPLQYVATPPEIADRLRREAHELEVAE